MAFLAVITLFASAATAAAQESRLEGRLDGRTRALVGAIVDSASAFGLPTEPLIDKALEGASKRADPSRIVAAVRALSRNLAAARLALGPDASVAELVAGASAIRVGVSPNALHRLREERPAGSIAVPLVVLADLIDRGVPADTAVALVSRLAANDAGDSRLVDLRRDVARDITDGVPPAVAAVLRTRGVLVANPPRGGRTAADANAPRPGNETAAGSKP